MRRAGTVLAAMALAACSGGPGIFEPAASTWQTMATWEGTGAFASEPFDAGVRDWRLSLTTTALTTCTERAAADCYANVWVARIHPTGVRYWSQLGGIEDVRTGVLLFGDGELPHSFAVHSVGVRWRVVVEAR